VRGDVLYSPGHAGRSAEFSGETHAELDVPGAFDRTDKFSLSLWLRYSGIQEMVILGRTEDARGLELFLEESVPIGDLKRGSRLRLRMARGARDAIDLRTRDYLVQGDWYHVALAYDGSGAASGAKLYLNGKLHEPEVIRDSLSGDTGIQTSFEIGNKSKGRPYKGRIDDLRIYSRPLAAEEIEVLTTHVPIRAILRDPPARRSEEQRDTLREYYLAYVAPREWRDLHAGLKQLYREVDRIKKAIPTVMVMSELTEPRGTFVLGRGDYRNPGEQVTPGVPAVLPPLPTGAPANRLGLARWLVDPAHPLTARVAVNRLWQMLFGTGLVKTAENFGSQGEPPSHPELLDWLATEFVRLGWDVKGIQKLILTSATYRQSSRVTPELLERDPENRLLARGPRFRLPAETVRDNALFVSGLLNSDIGGPGVFPYQPKGVWEEIAYGDVYSAQTYTPSHARDLYRRSMYTFWKRTAPPPALATFDAPDREKCTARRPVTNTPLQALVLMNDATYLEAARALAQRVIKDAGPDVASRIGLAFRLATGRRPEACEAQVLSHLANTKLARFRADKDAAVKLLRVGESAFDPKLDEAELAAWTMVASVILNLDETITKE